MTPQRERAIVVVFCVLCWLALAAVGGWMAHGIVR